jgi:septum formation protein
MTGCYASVMGLPLCHVVRMLRKMGVQPMSDVTEGCQQLLDYPCPVYKTILSN